MSYTTKNGKLVKSAHNQDRVDGYCKQIKDTRQQISQADMLASIGKGGSVIHSMMAHDDWCPTMKTGNGNDCTCEPDVTYYKE